MSNINRTGTFRGVDVKGVIDQSSGGHVQWVADLQAVEYYDEDTEQWIDWNQYEEKEIRCWLMLFDKDPSKKPYLNVKQLIKAGRWTGESYQELTQPAPDGLLFQFRVGEDTYQGKTNLRVEWVDAYDAEPGRSLDGLDTAEVKKLDAKYAAVLRKLSGGPKPKTVPDRPDKPEKPAMPTTSKTTAKEAIKEQTAEKAARGKAAETKAAKREKSTKPPKPPISQPKTAETVETCTKDEAWEACYTNKGSLTDDKLAEIWVGVIEERGGEDNFTGSHWAEVRDAVVDKMSVPI